MINFRVAILFLFSVFLFFQCSTQHPITVKPVTHLEAGHSKQGYYYTLPRTVVSVEVTLLKTEKIPGPFARYAETLLGLENVIMRPSEKYSIYDISVNSYAEPDPGAFYFIEIDPKKNQKNPLAISLTETGLITGINLSKEPEDNLRSRPGERQQEDYDTQATFNHFIETNLQEKIDTIVERVRMDTVTIEKETLRRTWVEKTSEVRAQEVADYILDIRNKRFDIINGFAEITYSKEALQYMNEELQKMENDYLELFTGITSQSTMRYRFYYIPEKNEAGNPRELFHFDEGLGLISEPTATSQTIEMTVSRDYATRQMGVFTLDPAGKKPTEQGIFYRIPEHGIVTISNNTSILADARLIVNQFGIITSLPPEDLKVEFDPMTGSLKSVDRNNQ